MTGYTKTLYQGMILIKDKGKRIVQIKFDHAPNSETISFTEKCGFTHNVSDALTWEKKLTKKSGKDAKKCIYHIIDNIPQSED